MHKTTTITAPATRARVSAQQDPAWVKWLLITLALLTIGVLIVVPVVNVFYQAFSGGVKAYWNNLFHDRDTWKAILLTLTVAPVAVVLNVVFGVAAAWTIARFRFPGRTILTALVDLPFSVSPVVAGLVLMLIFGLQGYLGPWLRDHHLKIIFATPGLILATAFVTMPFVARELIPVMEALGSEEEVAAVSLGAGAWQLFWRVTVPNIKWGLLYGVILCNARAMGEFGAVYVVSGHIAGRTDTMPLRVQRLFEDYNNPASFAVASVLTLLALVTLVVKVGLEHKTRRDIQEAVSLAGKVVSIAVKNINKKFGEFVALDNVSVNVPHGQLLALLGPSGSGKTTLLRIIAGLEQADSGSVHFANEDITDSSARDRAVGFVFQHYALFRHMTVFENVAFGLRVRSEKKDKITERVRELLHLVRLDGLERRFPSQLSGGQRQRVALARALAIRPKVLLLDEPFGALDAKVRQELRAWLRALHDEIHMTSVFVTHDQEEAFEVADQVVVMNRGRVEQVGQPHEVFEHPANPFVMDFLGNVNVFKGRVQNGRAVLGPFEVDFPEYPHAEPREANVYFRPHELDIQHHRNGVPALAATVQRVNSAGSVAKVALLAEDLNMDLNVELSLVRYVELALKAGDRVYVSPRKARVFMPEYVI